MNHLLTDDTLERSPIVANCRMNRERGLSGRNSYTRELGLQPVDFLSARIQAGLDVAWLDLCCGSGRALIEAAAIVQRLGIRSRVRLIGIDLVSMFVAHPFEHDFVDLKAASLATWVPDIDFDLITCVHGLHYIGDKLGLIQQAMSWLKDDGLFAAHLDFANICLSNRASAAVITGKDLRKAGFEYRSSKRVLLGRGRRSITLSYRYLGADDTAGPNYTGQPAINSYYERG